MRSTTPILITSSVGFKTHAYTILPRATILLGAILSISHTSSIMVILPRWTITLSFSPTLLYMLRAFLSFYFLM